MKYLLLFLFSFLLYTTVFSQTIEERLAYANKIYYSNPDSNLILCNELELDVKTQNDLGDVYLCQARYYILKTKYDKGTTLINKALEIFKKENNLSKQAKCYSLKSIYLARVSSEEKALVERKKALILYTQANDTSGQASALTNISLSYLNKQQNDTALIYLIKLKHLSKNIKESSKYYMHQNFATYFDNVNDYDASIASYKKAFTIADNLDMIDSKATVLMLIASPYIAKKKYKVAEESLYKSLAIATGNNLLLESSEAYTELIKLYEILGNYKQAYKLEKLNDAIEKEIYSLDKINRINEIESQLKLTEKEKIITQKELEIKNEQLNTIEAKSKITQLFFVIGISLIIIIFIIFVLMRTKKLNTKIHSQKMMLEEKNTEITDSINYAKRIQSAILPDINLFKKGLPNSFILYKPKDIVAGDFYWMKSIDNTVLYAAADCTGHGVPGAMVSVVCSNALNQSVKELQTSNPAKILDFTRNLVKENLKSEDESVKDGMDIALCSINLTTKEMNFSGANNPLYIIRKDELIEIKGDKQPVSKYFKEQPFSNHSCQLQKDDMIYTFSDGYADQFGGPNRASRQAGGKKFMSKQFKKLLTSIATKPIEKQHEILNQTFENWKGDLEQIDDVCIIGVRI